MIILISIFFHDDNIPKRVKWSRLIGRSADSDVNVGTSDVILKWFRVAGGQRFFIGLGNQQIISKRNHAWLSKFLIFYLWLLWFYFLDDADSFFLKFLLFLYWIRLYSLHHHLGYLIFFILYFVFLFFLVFVVDLFLGHFIFLEFHGRYIYLSTIILRVVFGEVTWNNQFGLICSLSFFNFLFYFLCLVRVDLILQEGIFYLTSLF